MMKKFIKYYLLATLVVVVVVGVWIAIPFWEAKAPVEAGTLFLNNLKNGEMAEAYNQTSKSFQKNVTQNQMEGFVRANPILTKNDEFSFYTRQIEDGFAKFGGHMISDGAGMEQINVQLVFESEEWRILSFDHEEPLVIDERTKNDISFIHFQF